MPTTTAPKHTQAQEKKKKNWPVLILALLALLLLASLVIFLVVGRMAKGPSGPPALHQDPNVQIGSATMTREERVEALNKEVDEGMLTFSINSTPMYSLSNTEQGVNWVIENPPDNGNRFTVTIELTDTGEVVYASEGYLDPEQYIETGPLETPLPKGEYDCVAYFDVYSIEDNSFIGRGGAAITLYVVD